MSQPPVIGSPETMIKRIQEIARIGQCGRFDFVLLHRKLPQE